MNSLERHELARSERLAATSRPYPLAADKMYEVRVQSRGGGGASSSAYLAMIFLDSVHQEIARRVCWMNGEGDERREHLIRARPVPGAREAVVAYRINTELPPHRSPAAVAVELQPIGDLRIEETDAPEERYGDWRYEETDWQSITPPEHYEDDFGDDGIIDIGSAPGTPAPAHRRVPVRPSLERLMEDMKYVTKLLAENDADASDYLMYYTSYHLRRFVSTFSLVPSGTAGDRLLELGAFPPLTFVMNRYLGYGEVRITDQPWHAGQTTATSAIRDRRGVTIRLHYELFDAERDVFPYEDSYFSTVICTEMLEHMHIDPMFMLGQINRVLEEGGHLVLSTPNLTGSRNVRAILEGRNPTGLNTYHIGGNVNSRHNREYTPVEVRQTLEAAGFEVVHLDTVNTWGEDDDEVIDQLERLGYGTEMRGDNIFCVARKVRDGVNERHPLHLYHH